MGNSADDPLSISRERVAVLALSTVSFALALNVHVFGALGPFLPEIFGESRLGLLTGATPLAMAVASVVAGPLVDRHGRRGPLLWGTGLFAGASLLHLLVDGLGAHLALRLVTGVGAGLVQTCATAAIADIVPYERRGAAMGLWTAMLFLALPVGLPLAVVCADAGHWRAVFLFQVVVAAGAVVAMAFTLPERLGGAARAEMPWRVLREPMVTPALLSVMLYSGAFFASVQFVALWLHESGVLNRSDQPLMWITLGLTSALGGVGLTRFADKLGKRQFVLWSTMLVCICLLVLGRVSTLGAVVAIGVPLSAIGAARSGAFTALMSQLVTSERQATLMGVRSAVVSLGLGGFALLGDVVYPRAGYGGFVMVNALAVAAAYFLVRLWVEERT